MVLGGVVICILNILFFTTSLWSLLQRLSWWVMAIIPGLLIALLGILGEVCPNWYTYLLALIGFLWLVKLFIR